MGTFRTIKKIVSSTTKYVDDLNKTVQGTDYLEQGHDFERHVISLFNKQYFTLVHWTSDVSRKHEGIQAESDKAPDLRMRYNPTREEFYVECKFRSGLTPEGKLKWVSSDYSLNKYQRYAETLPFFVVAGLAGDCQKPKQMFCIPLKEAKWQELYPSVFMKFERRPPDKQFFWRNGVLS